MHNPIKWTIFKEAIATSRDRRKCVSQKIQPQKKNHDAMLFWIRLVDAIKQIKIVTNYVGTFHVENHWWKTYAFLNNWFQSKLEMTRDQTHLI